MNIISLYTGAGGLDLGLEAAGFDVAVCVEYDRDSAATIRANRSWPVIQRDIHSVSSTEILETAGLRVGDVDLLVGGPPCQPFSKSAYWATGDTKRLDDPRASTLEQFLRVLRDTKPQVFLLENVPGLGYKGKDEGLSKLSRVLKAINRDAGTNYRPCVKILSAVQYGVPQERERLFIVAHREGLGFEYPGPTHADVESGHDLTLEGLHLEPYRTAWDAIGDIEEDPADPTLAVTGKWADLLPSIPEGSNYLHHTDRGDGVPLFGWRRRYWNFLLKLSKSRHSWTITAQPGPATGPFHWENRRLSPRELCRLQTFPDGYHVVGDVRSAHRQIGNAVPAALAESLGHAIRAHLLDERYRMPRFPSLIPPRRGPVPPPESTRPVPNKYMTWRGTHEPHPGTGKGYSASERTPV
jgi:DNA (cytosine-5)-methyltransferase 1